MDLCISFVLLYEIKCILCLLLAVLQKTVASCTAKTGKAFMMELRRCLSHENFKLIMEALQSYKTTDDLSDLLANVTEPLIQDHNTHCLLRGVKSRHILQANYIPTANSTNMPSNI